MAAGRWRAPGGPALASAQSAVLGAARRGHGVVVGISVSANPVSLGEGCSNGPVCTDTAAMWAGRCGIGQCPLEGKKTFKQYQEKRAFFADTLENLSLTGIARLAGCTEN